MTSRELQERIAEFPSWPYMFEFEGGVSTPIDHPLLLNRHEQRRRYFFDPLLSINGGSLRGRRVLDLGCNAGFWSLNAIEAGADFVLGVDGRQVHVDQSRLVFEAKGIDHARYRFERGNVFEHDFGEDFDLVLCFGLLYHVAKPFELFERMTATGAETVVVDTTVFPAPFSFFKVYHEDTDEPQNSLDYEMVLVPTKRAVIDLANQFGFEAMALKPEMTDYSGAEDYRDRRRMAFICSKGISLDSLPKAKGPLAPWLLLPAAKSACRRLRRR